MRIVLLGAPAQGKGTQTDSIIERYGISTVATGDLLRAEVAAGTELGRRAKPYMDAGELVPFDIVLGMIENGLRTLAKTNPKGFMMDGFPRDLAQAEALDKLLAKINQPLDLVLFFEVDYEEIVKRLLGRGRADDNEDTIRNRLRVYEEKTAPLIDYYTKKGLLRTVKGTGTIEDIGQRIRAVLDEHRLSPCCLKSTRVLSQPFLPGREPIVPLTNRPVRRFVQPPRYAFRTSSLASRFAPVSASTMRPFSST
ncbi:MAG: adenylate kinase [Comamonadaceae bacterium]|nr:adenylate kinase [Comamonadaceae bacterium]